MVVGSKRVKGVTLIELLVALSIIGILSIIAMPSFVQQIKQDRLTNTANLMSAFYKYSRSEAVKQAKSVQLVDNGSSWLVRSTDSNGQLQTLNQFSVTHSSISISYVDRTISSTGELNQIIDILISDNDSASDDYRFCVLQSGQSWINEAEINC
ncbi:hypothetical protein PSECIP111951_02693 [Pseudoalteromonas holothuriae]|uniref:Type II secretion system protein H n=1 Tax=Pseudoalteromonas holothuriae TaxID=2963714 RepID=A0ABM9GK42_9GAMM|nr:hypothetical protein PSECIP111951_02693 [Pseudoalteromonas sp. CIP111951]